MRKNEETPLHLASFNKNANIFELLVTNGASLEEKNNVDYFIIYLIFYQSVKKNLLN